MSFGDTHGIGTYGWYYYNVNDRAAAWTEVYRFHDFLVDEVYIWDVGPEGCELPLKQAQVGDVIQYDWDGDGDWDHSVIIVLKGTGGQEPQYWVAGHSPDVDYYPYETENYGDIRFIHIERIDGFAAYLPIVICEDCGMMDQIDDPYPPPLDNGDTEPAPYPAPVESKTDQ